MRFCYAILAAAAMLLATTSAVAAGVEQNQISQMNPERVVRSLRYVDEDVLEERATGINAKALSKIVKSKQGTLPFNVAQKLSRSKQDWALGVWVRQNLNQKQFAQKLDMKSVDDLKHTNAKFFEQFKSHFPAI